VLDLEIQHVDSNIDDRDLISQIEYFCIAHRTLAPGDIVLLENLRSQKIAGIAEAIAARQAQLIYQPPYRARTNERSIFVA
jgi:hypothetical protein